jgi:hypothetical protein
MHHDFRKISENARKLILASGGTIERSQYYESLETVYLPGTELTENIQHAGWGNFSYEEWSLPGGGSLCWDSDDRELQVASYPEKTTEPTK